MKGYPKLKAVLVEKGIKQSDIAKELGFPMSTFSGKLNGRGDFSVTEAKKICEYLGTTSDIFLN